MNLILKSREKPTKHTLVNTAIEAYELPKLMPTTGGRVEIGIGASGPPFFVGFVAIRSLKKSKKKAKKHERCRH